MRSAPPAQGLYNPAYEHDACGIGFVAHVHGQRSGDIVAQALEVLTNLGHRGATSGDVGDGAGILLQLPHALLRRDCRARGIPLPDAGGYGIGMVFLPADAEAQRQAVEAIERIVASHALRVLGWRDVPVDDRHIGAAARASRPAIRQLVVAPTLELTADDGSSFERLLYRVRRAIERSVQGDCYVASLSSRTVVYKGLMRAEQLGRFYADLTDPAMASALALVHSRFSTNTFPSWALAHPYRMICHNGEINTVSGNLAWMRAREGAMSSSRLGGTEGMSALVPLIPPGQSDSASLDNVLELLVNAGRPIAHALSMLVPEAWEGDDDMAPDLRAFYEFHASIVEPWDGPAAVAFTDGRQIGAALDRNGLRPARWVMTRDHRVILASEAGAIAVDEGLVRQRGRLRPGSMFLVNTTQGRVWFDGEIKRELSARAPYRHWLATHTVRLSPSQNPAPSIDAERLRRLQRTFGYTREEIAMVIAPMALGGEEALGSMGNDTPLAALSTEPQLLYSYFRQRFAQVTNPPIDPIREALVMSLHTWLGAERNLLDETPEHAHRIRVERPVLTSADLAALRAIEDPALRAVTLPALFPVNDPHALASAVETLCEAAAVAARSSCGTIILSDRHADDDHAPMPSLLAVAAVHHHLIRAGLRSRVGLVVETGDAREGSHVALLFAYGAGAVSPYVALATCASLSGTLGEENYFHAIEKALLKILSKMGVSTLQGYCGAQLWEAVGLDRDLIDRHFTGTSSRLGGLGLAEIAGDVLRRVRGNAALLDAGGVYHYRADGEAHAWNPEAIATLQRATREGVTATYREFSRMANDPARSGATVRGLLDVVAREPVPLAEVEPSASIVRRFTTGAMSFGSISAEAHETIALAMNAIGGRSNTGEGGEDPARFGTARNSAIKQVASARFGVTTEYLVSAREIQIKMAQGAKPGEGGQLPGHKVDAVIARTRHATAGVTLISPPPHHDIYSIEDLKQLIYDLRCVNPEATISVKLVAEAGVGTVAAGVVKAGADLVTISGDSGGTGASPLSSIKRAGTPWELGLAETQQTLLLNDLRGGVRLQVDGQLKTGRDVVIAALLGAEEFGFATAPLVVEGCVMMRKCHLNTCPVGIATQDPVLRERFTGRPEHLVNYFFFVADEVRELMAQLGFRTIDEMVGRTDVLRVCDAPGAVRRLDLAPLLHAAAIPANEIRGVSRARHDAPSALDRELLALARPALEHGDRVSVARTVNTADRAIGALVSGEIARRHGAAGLPDDSIVVRLSGTAGQSFGAFAARGLTLDLEGEANDYVGKGLSGGRLIVRPRRLARVGPEGDVIVGNTVLYGATSGEAFIAGGAGERFAVRNSGATAVVEAVGDHGCEYMTGGTVVVLGVVGRNFAAGMSGGRAFVLDADRSLVRRVASSSIEVGAVMDPVEREELHRLVERHARLTASRRARQLLVRWRETLDGFVRVISFEYKRALTLRDSQRIDEARHG